MLTGGFRSRDVMEHAIEDQEVDAVGLARPFCTQPDFPKRLIERSLDEVDMYEDTLVLGTGFWGNNSSSEVVKAINNFGGGRFLLLADYSNFAKPADPNRAEGVPIFPKTHEPGFPAKYKEEMEGQGQGAETSCRRQSVYTTR